MKTLRVPDNVLIKLRVVNGSFDKNFELEEVAHCKSRITDSYIAGMELPIF